MDDKMVAFIALGLSIINSVVLGWGFKMKYHVLKLESEEAKDKLAKKKLEKTLDRFYPGLRQHLRQHLRDQDGEDKEGLLP